MVKAGSGPTTDEADGTIVDESCCLGSGDNRESNESERLSAFPVSYPGPDTLRTGADKPSTKVMNH